MKKSAIKCVSVAFTYDDMSRVSWKRTGKIDGQRRPIFDVSVSVQTPVGGFLSEHYEVGYNMPTDKRSKELISDMRRDRPGLR